MSKDSIYFYHQNEKYGCFSNFSDHSIKLENKLWPTTEHYFQAKKFENTPYEEKIRLAKTAGEAKKLGSTRSKPLRKDWEEVKEKFMLKAIEAKFSQNLDCQKILLSTGDKKIIEKANRDFYWGIGDGTGKNRLGVLLMEARKRIIVEKQKKSQYQ